jgi:hypothetical protein
MMKELKDTTMEPDRYTLVWVAGKRTFSLVLSSVSKKFFYYLFILAFFSICVFGFGHLGLWLMDDHLELEGEQLGKFKNQLSFLEKQSSQLVDCNQGIFGQDDRLRVMYGIRPMPPEIREVGVGGPENLSDYNRFFRTEVEGRIFSLRRLQQKMDRQLDLQKASLEEIDRQMKFTQAYYQHLPSVYPTDGRVTSGFGSRVHPIFERSLIHAGIDIANRIGTPVTATADGIATTGFSDTYGRYVFLTHGNGYTSFYAHLNKVAALNGAPVKRHQIIGYIGETGLATGPHLHYEVRRNQSAQNPEYFFLPLQNVVD